MKTKRAPWDYSHAVVIKPQLIKLCATCGANFFIHPDGIKRCVSCRCLEFVELYEHQALTFRRELMQKQEEAAKWMALCIRPQMDYLLENIGTALNMTPETEAEMNRWIVEDETWKIEQHVASAYGTADLGTHCIVSGGEVLELDAPQTEADDDEYPF